MSHHFSFSKIRERERERERERVKKQTTPHLAEVDDDDDGGIPQNLSDLSSF